ncbi:hypothetical protein CKAH01_17474 [Colletotrichum kahawae]|uniref:Uncharacterized protein n=1 Tax=Colletotrichum kahawae TaxID=34407 RepID=A0AAE0D4D9_COLKA|nr:hypothetical protein CKAH01_17474 [Colletotrichum kahawae]
MHIGRDRPASSPEAVKCDTESSVNIQSLAHDPRDSETRQSDENFPCTCNIDPVVPECYDTCDDSGEIHGYFDLSNECCTVRTHADHDEAGIQREYLSMEAMCLHWSLNKNYEKMGAKFIGWSVELTRSDIAELKSSQEFKAAVWLDLCRRHNPERWVRKYFVWSRKVHDQSHIDGVFAKLVQIAGGSKVGVKSCWDACRSSHDVDRRDGPIVQAQIFPEIHFVEHDSKLEERDYVSLHYMFPLRSGLSVQAKKRIANVEPDGRWRT